MKLSIITINRNNAEGLRKTMESVFVQTCRDFEYIVIDGASTDESVDIIKEFAEKYTFPSGGGGVGSFKWVSEPDTGIYNAMNKGIRMSRGEYSLMLNSGIAWQIMMLSSVSYRNYRGQILFRGVCTCTRKMQSI